MKRAITISEGIIALVLTITGLWVGINNAVAALEVKVEIHERRIEKIEDKLDIIISGINDIKIELKDKQNRNQ
jgi:hypothetical protein